MMLATWLRPSPLSGYLAHTFAWSWTCWGLSPASGHLLMILVNPPLILLLGGPLGEEFGWLFNRTAGSVVAVLVLHTAINFWPTVVPVLPTEASDRAYAFVVAMLVLLAFGLMTRRSVVDTPADCLQAKP